MLWRIMWSNFECILHNACAFKIFLSIFFSVCLNFYLFPQVYRWVHMIYDQWLHHSIHYSFLLKYDCHRQMCVVWTVLKHRNIQYSCIYKHHHKFSGGFPGYPFYFYQCLIQVQWSLQMIHIHIFPTLLFLFPLPL